ncbi:hypothetical protein [Dysosmobacter sp.]|uniref:hypothetical protein n=1 Tax=Dysosmobacter sp. TaxID=2591382 RepID=UPI003A920CD0
MSTNKKPNIDLADHDFGCLVTCAIRYCLGRCTYMPKLVCDFVFPLLPYLDDQTIGCMERDIREAPFYGMDCDYATWMQFLKQIRAEMERRHIAPWQ